MTETPDQPSRRLGRPRSSLRTMFLVMTAMAAALSGIFAGPAWVGVLVVLLFVTAAPIALTIATIFSKGYVRIFCLGALLGSISWFLTISPDFFWSMLYGKLGSPDQEAALEEVMIIAFGFLVPGVYGLICVGIAWVVVLTGHKQPVK